MWNEMGRDSVSSLVALVVSWLPTGDMSRSSQSEQRSSVGGGLTRDKCRERGKRRGEKARLVERHPPKQVERSLDYEMRLKSGTHQSEHLFSFVSLANVSTQSMSAEESHLCFPTPVMLDRGAFEPS
jgi:hypothetical protein